MASKTYFKPIMSVCLPKNREEQSWCDIYLLLLFFFLGKNLFFVQWRSQGHCFEGQVASGEDILGGPPPNFYTDLDFRMVLNTIGGGGGHPSSPPPPLTTPLSLCIFLVGSRFILGSIALGFMQMFCQN